MDKAGGTAPPPGPASATPAGRGPSRPPRLTAGAPFGLTTAAARMLLAPVGDPSGLAEAVAQRLSEAIRLGLLLDGERLPPEPGLAGQLGVSTVTLREALAVLRGQGLVITRRGRGGGTFVSVPDLAGELAGRLRELTIEQLRDLGDHRAAISGSAARLAAHRALPAEVAELTSQLGRLGTAATASERRRASAQFAVAIAAAGQSARLVREELRLAAEVGGLVWLRATEGDHEAAVTAGKQLVAAIAAADAPAARTAAERQVHTETTRLIELRLQAYALDAEVSV